MEKQTMSGWNPDEITTEGTILYLSSYVETMKDRIKDGDPRALLYEERIAFLNRAIYDMKMLLEEE